VDELSDEDQWLKEREANSQPLEPDEWVLEIVTRFSADLPAGYDARCEPDEEMGLRFVALRDGDRVSNVFLNRDTLGRPIQDLSAIGWKLRELQGELIEHSFGYAWPRCPVHGSHPLRAEGDGWHCLTSLPPSSVPNAPEPGQQLWEYGSLAQFPVPPEQPRPDGTVRWYLDDLGWGVIAHQQGDLFVHFSSIIGVGYRSLGEGQPVTFNVASGSQGRFRRAEHVKAAAQSVRPPTA